MFSQQALPVAIRRLMPGGFLLAMFTLTACVTVPEAIRGTSLTPQDDLVRVMNAPQLYIGQEGRFGGKVVKVTNETGRSRLEIATVPLDDGAVPLMHQPSVGRIIAQISSFVEPSDLKGQWITVVGPITGTEKGHIDKADYTYMVMQVAHRASGFRADGATAWALGLGLPLRLALGARLRPSMGRLLRRHAG